MNAVYEKLFKETLGDIPLVYKELSIDPVQQVGSGQRISVVNIPGSKDKIKDLSLVVDDLMHLQSIGQSNAAVAFGSETSEDFMRVFWFDMTGSD